MADRGSEAFLFSASHQKGQDSGHVTLSDGHRGGRTENQLHFRTVSLISGTVPRMLAQLGKPSECASLDIDQDGGTVRFMREAKVTGRALILGHERTGSSKPPTQETRELQGSPQLDMTTGGITIPHLVLEPEEA